MSIAASRGRQKQQQSQCREVGEDCPPSHNPSGLGRVKLVVRLWPTEPSPNSPVCPVPRHPFSCLSTVASVPIVIDEGVFPGYSLYHVLEMEEAAADQGEHCQDRRSCERGEGTCDVAKPGPAGTHWGTVAVFCHLRWRGDRAYLGGFKFLLLQPQVALKVGRKAALHRRSGA